MTSLILYIGRIVLHASLFPLTKLISFITSANSSPSSYWDNPLNDYYYNSLAFDKMTFNTKLPQIKPEIGMQPGASPNLMASRTDKDNEPNLPSTTGYNQQCHPLQIFSVLHPVSSRVASSSFTHSPTQSSEHCSNISTRTHPSHRETQPINSQSKSTNDQKDKLDLSSIVEAYNPMERWETQTPREDPWSHFVMLEKRSLELNSGDEDIVGETGMKEKV
jgi:hypothetical protein